MKYPIGIQTLEGIINGGYIILSALLFLTFIACQKQYPVAAKLQQAETVMNEHPDSALNLLKGIAQTELQTQAHHARYALLYSQALDKNYIDVTNDSLINIAVDYYKDRDDVRAKFLSYYYLGRIYTNANNLTQATLAYMEAEQLVDELGDDYLAGLLHKQIGLIYYAYCDFTKSSQSHLQAIEYFAKANKPIHKVQAMLTLSGIHRNMNEEEKSYLVLKSALEESRKLDNPSLLKSCIGNLILVHIDMEQWTEASQLYQKHIKYYDFTNMTASFDAYIARLHAKNNQLKEAFYYLDTGWGKAKNLQDSINLYNAESQIHLMNESWEESYRSMEKCITFQNKIIRKSLQQPILTIQKDFFNQELAFKTYKLRMEKILRVISISIVSAISLVLIFFMRKKLHKRYLEKLQEQAHEQEQHIKKIQKEAIEREQGIRSIISLLEKEQKEKDYLSSQHIERLKTELEFARLHIKESQKVQKESSDYIKELCHQKQVLKEDVNHLSATVSKLQQENNVYLINHNLKGKLLKKYFNLMEDFISIDNKTYEKEEDKQLLLKKLHEKIVNSFSGNKRADAKLEKMVNECNNDIMKHLRAEISLPDETYYLLACYLLAGYSVSVIACAMQETTNAIYKRRDKIRCIIKESETEHKQLFLQL